jgi:hypothetical protein
MNRNALFVNLFNIKINVKTQLKNVQKMVNVVNLFKKMVSKDVNVKNVPLNLIVNGINKEKYVGIQIMSAPVKNVVNLLVNGY